MDKKLEARIARLERAMGRKFEAADDAKDDEKAWKEFDEVVKERMRNEAIMSNLEYDINDGLHSDVISVPMKEVAGDGDADEPELKRIFSKMASLADLVESTYNKAKDAVAECSAKEEQMRVDNGWTKKAVKERIKGIRGW